MQDDLGAEQAPDPALEFPEETESTGPDPMDDYIGRLPKLSKEIANAIYKRAEKWKQAQDSNGLYRQAKENFRIYHNAEPDGLQFNERSFSLSGENGEYLRMRVNKLRKWLTYVLNIATAQKQTMQSKAANSEADSLIAAQMFDGLLDFFKTYWKRGRSDKQLRKAKELSLFTPLAGVLVEWDPMGGNDYVPDAAGMMLKEGDLYVKARSFWDIWYDTNTEDDEESNWFIIRDYYNKYDLAENFGKADPETKRNILSLQSKIEVDKTAFWGWDDQTDLVPVYKFYHRSSPACPKGRMAWVCEGGVVLIDQDNPYVDDEGVAVIPLLLMRAADGIGTINGYAPANDLSPIVQAENMTLSGVMTNEAAFGVGNIAVERGSDISVQTLSGGLNVIEYGQGKQMPQPFSVSSNEQQSISVLQMLDATGEGMAGLNGAITGNADVVTRAASGRVMGLLQSQAVQYQSGFNEACAQLEEDFGNLLLLICKRFVNTQRITRIVGKDKVLRLATWTGDTFRAVSRIVAEPVNPISKTTAGAREEAEFLLTNNIISTPQEYLMVRNTGQLEPLFKSDQAQLNLIQQENEALLKGDQAPVLFTDNHAWHIPEHLALVASPAIRTNGAAVQAILAHVQQHQELFAQQQPPPEEQPQDGKQGKKPPQKQQQKPGGEQQANGPQGEPVPVPPEATVTPNMVPQ